MILASVLFSVILISGSIVPSYSEYISPKKQLDSGVLPEDVICRDDKVLVIRGNGNPACVTEITAEKTGWEIIKTEFEIPVIINTSDEFDIKQTDIEDKQTETLLYDDTVTVLVKSEETFVPKDKSFGAYSEILSKQRDPSPRTYDQSAVDKIVEIKDRHIMQQQLANELGVTITSSDPQTHRGFIINDWVPTEIPSGYELKVSRWSGPFEGPISTIERLNLAYAPITVLLTSQNFTRTVHDSQGFSIGGTYRISDPDSESDIQQYIDQLLSYGVWQETTINGKRAVVADLTVEHRAAVKVITSDYEFSGTSYYHTATELTDIIKSIPALQ